MSAENSCGRGRSPTGKCCGWHNLTEEQFAEKKHSGKLSKLKRKRPSLLHLLYLLKQPELGHPRLGFFLV